MGLGRTVNDRYSNGISALVSVGVSRSALLSVPEAQRSWMTITVYFPRRIYAISDSTDEYLDEGRTRGNNKWIFYSDLAGVESHFLIYSFLT